MKIDLEGPEEVTSENEISDSSIAGLNSNESNFNLNISLKQINNYKIKLIFSNQVYALFVVKNQVMIKFLTNLTLQTRSKRIY